MTMSLYALSARYQQAFLSLADSDYDETTISDTLEGMEGEIVDKGRNVAAFFLNLDVEISAIKQAEDNIAKRRKTLENKRDRLKEYLKEQMSKCAITEIKAIDGTFTAKLYIGRDESVVIDDADVLPMDYKREIPATYAPDKKLIMADLKKGIEVKGAHIQHKDRLTIA